MSEIAHLGPGRRELRRTAGVGELPVLSAGSTQERTRVVVIGEFNSGKTSLVNAMLGAAVLPASYTTHTVYPTVVRFARKPSLSAEIEQRKRVPIAWEDVDEGASSRICRLHVGAPVDRLRTLRVLDTPGLGRGNDLLGASTLRACRRADIVIWCTPAMQAWKATEHQVWLALPKSVRRRGVLAVTFMDVLRSQRDASRLMMRLHADAGDLFRRIVSSSALGFDPVLRGSSETAGG